MDTRIENDLRKALLQNGEMSFGLFEYELKEHIEYWRKSMEQDKDELLFVVTWNNGDVAMLLMTTEGEFFINEKARDQLRATWNRKNAYSKNITYLLPMMINEIENGIIPVHGVKSR